MVFVVASKLEECYGVTDDEIKLIGRDIRKSVDGVVVCVVRLGDLLSLIGVEVL